MDASQSHTNATGDQADREYFMLSMRMLRTAHSSSGAEITKFERPKEFESLPLFGSLSAYDVDEVTEARLWELEAGRLFEALGGPRLFPESATATPEPDKSNTNAFDQVELLASPVLSALAIYGLDDQSSLKTQQSYGDLVTDSVSERAIKRLERRFGRVDQVVRLRDVRHGMVYYEEIRVERVENNTAVPAEPTPEKAVNVISDTDARRYYALIDYLTATVVCYIASGFEDDGIHRPKSYWQAITLTVIAKIAVKMKILVRCLPTFAKTSMLSWQRSGVLSSGSPPPTPHWHTSTIRPPPPASQTNTPSEAQDSYVKAYLFDMCEVSSTLFSVMWSVLSDLKTRTSQRLQKDDFDISAIVYSMGTKHVPAMIYQDRLAQVAGSHTGMALGMGRRALDILVASADQIQQKHQAEDLNLSLHFQHSHPQLSIEIRTVTKVKLDIRIQSVAELISVMVPLSCMDPSTSSGMQRACNAISASSTLLKIHAAAQGYTATVNLRHTAQEPRQTVGMGDQPQGQALSKSIFFARHREAEPIQSGIIARFRMPSNTPRNTPWVRATFPDHVHLSISEASERWEIAETAITVACLDYTIPVIVGCAILVIGGLSAGFLVGERIAGVDPFNLTMFSWIIAGFIVLIAKSIRVAEWPWRDFLLGRVTTRSVRELVSVTGLDEQTVLLHLLSIDGKAPLVTRGPFNSVFASKGDGGFSIDVQPTLKTLLASGIIVLEVLSPGGPVLVCLDLRMEVATPRHPSLWKMLHNQSQDVSVLACLDVARDDDEHRDLGFSVYQLRWHKIIGIYYGEFRRVK